MSLYQRYCRQTGHLAQFGFSERAEKPSLQRPTHRHPKLGLSATVVHTRESLEKYGSEQK